MKFCIACEYSHWAFSAKLAFSFVGQLITKSFFSADICPPDHRLKMCLLLSLVSLIVKEDSRKKHGMWIGSRCSKVQLAN